MSYSMQQQLSSRFHFIPNERDAAEAELSSVQLMRNAQWHYCIYAATYPCAHYTSEAAIAVMVGMGKHPSTGACIQSGCGEHYAALIVLTIRAYSIRYCIYPDNTDGMQYSHFRQRYLKQLAWHSSHCSYLTVTHQFAWHSSPYSLIIFYIS